MKAPCASRRRILAASLGLLAASSLAPAQGRVSRIAWIAKAWGPAYPLSPGVMGVFKERLGELGYVEGRNLEIRVFTPKSQLSSDLEAAVRAAVEWKPDLIKVRNSVDTRAAQAVTSTIPIVFSMVGDPVPAGLIQSIQRPGGNATGVFFFYEEMTLKRLELAHEIVPGARRFGIVSDGSTSPGNATALAAARAAAARLGIGLDEVDVAKAPGGLQGALGIMEKKLRPSAVLCVGYIPGMDYMERFTTFQRQARIPVVDDTEEGVEAGMLAALYESTRDHMRRAAHVAAKVLQGQSPAVIPAEGSVRYGIAVNLPAANHLATPLPQALLLRADRVIR